MLMLCAVLFPILAGMGLAAWRPQGRMARQNYVLASACITSALALWAVFTLRDGPLFTLLTMGDHLYIAFRVDGLSLLFASLVAVLWPLACLYAV